MVNRCVDCGKVIKKTSTRCNKCSRQAQLEPIEDRFWSKVNKNGPIMPHMDTPCWVWTAGIFRQVFNGKEFFYGNFSIDGKNKHAHRVSWEMYHKKEIPEGMLVCHRCDNPPCVNPAHLFLGTHKDNMRDMAKKGRAGTKIGIDNQNTRLTRTKVSKIRTRYATGNISQRALAKEYGVTQTAIWYVLHHKNWK